MLLSLGSGGLLYLFCWSLLLFHNLPLSLQYIVRKILGPPTQFLNNLKPEQYINLYYAQSQTYAVNKMYLKCQRWLSGNSLCR